MKSLLEMIEENTGMHYRFKPTQKRYIGPCPYCGEGDDRFQIYVENHYWCRQCGRKGDRIDFLRDYVGLSYTEARAYLGEPLALSHHHHNHHHLHKRHKHKDADFRQPQYTVHIEGQSALTQAWLAQGWPFVYTCHECLMNDENPKARGWLHQRRLSDDLLGRVGVGYNPADTYVDRREWGLPPKINDKGKPSPLWLPRGITIPWLVDGELWGVRIRRPVGDPKYYWLPGGTPGLYNADQVRAGAPTILVEGELDALTIVQETGGTVAAVATGSTCGARHVRWLARLSTASKVLVAYDNDQPGEAAAVWWLDALTNARRWRPYWADANAMAQDGVNVARWVKAGLLAAGIAEVNLPKGLDDEGTDEGMP